MNADQFQKALVSSMRRLKALPAEKQKAYLIEIVKFVRHSAPADWVVELEKNQPLLEERLSKI